MRVIAGKYKGRNIDTLQAKGKNIRPTTGKTREALFNILSHGQFVETGKKLLEGARVLDLFCGSGALAIEALSRGAGFVVLIDMNKDHLEIARTNLKNIGEEQNAAFIRANSSTPPPAHVPCNLIFIDPPYNQGLAQTTLENLVKGNWLAERAIIVVETAKKEDITTPEGFEELTDRHYGNSRIRILRWNGKKQA
jgi:16S rRNA (guanine966-N2)-methyltransferase